MFMPKKSLSTCSNCGYVFDFKDATIVPRKLYGVDVNEPRCPACNSPGFTTEWHIGWLRRYEQLNFN